MRCAAFAELIRACGSSASEVPAQSLLALDRLEQCLEISGAEALRTLPLNDLVEDSRAILDRLGEDLQQISLVVAIDQDAELLERGEILVDLPHPVRHAVVIRGRHPEKLDAPRLQ